MYCANRYATTFKLETNADCKNNYKKLKTWIIL